MLRSGGSIGAIVFTVLYAPVFGKMDGIPPVQPTNFQVSKSTDTPRGKAIKTTICELVKNPVPFSGKMVQVRALISTGFEFSLLEDKSCDSRIWFTGPGATYMTIGKPPTPGGPIVLPRIDGEYRKMEYYLSKEYHPRKYFPWQKVGFCISCPLYTVNGTVTGRFDYLDPSVPYRGGFSHLSGWDSQLVLESVSDVLVERIDPSLYKNK